MGAMHDAVTTLEQLMRAEQGIARRRSVWPKRARAQQLAAEAAHDLAVEAAKVVAAAHDPGHYAEHWREVLVEAADAQTRAVLVQRGQEIVDERVAARALEVDTVVVVPAHESITDALFAPRAPRS